MRIEILVLIIGTTLISGCAWRTNTVHVTTASHIPPLTQLLFYSRALQQASPGARVSMLHTARKDYEQQASAANGARLALAYGQPQQVGYAPAKCRHYVQLALADAPRHWDLTTTAYLRQIQALCRDNAAMRKQLHDLRGQLETLQQKNTKQQQALAKAQAKLQALTELGKQLTP